MKILLAYSLADFIHENCVGSSSNPHLYENFLRNIVGKPKSTGSKIRSQLLRWPNPGESQGPSSPVSDGHNLRNLSCHMVFPTSHPYVTGCPLPSRCCSNVFCAMKPLPTALSRVPGHSLCTAGVRHTRTSTAALIAIYSLSPLPVSSRS